MTGGTITNSAAGGYTMYLQGSVKMVLDGGSVTQTYNSGQSGQGGTAIWMQGSSSKLGIVSGTISASDPSNQAIYATANNVVFFQGGTVPAGSIVCNLTGDSRPWGYYVNSSAAFLSSNFILSNSYPSGWNSSANRWN